MWSQAKDILYGKVNRMPERIIENNKIVLGSKNVANCFNRHFIRKISEIEKNLPETDIDPMIYYKKYIPKFSNQFSMKEINMSQLRVQLTKIKNTNSTDFFWNFYVNGQENQKIN